MEVKAAATCLQWSLPVVKPQFPSSSNTLASAISSRALVCRFDRSSLFRTSFKLLKFRSYEKKYRSQNLRTSCKASLNEFSDEEFSKQIQELAQRFQLSGDSNNNNNNNDSDDADYKIIPDSRFTASNNISRNCNEDFPKNNPVQSSVPFHLWLGIKPEQPDWAGKEEIIPAIIERKANSVDLPHSLRIIKRKNMWEEEIREAGESALCSVKKAFSSMVFIIREIQSYTLQMREILFFEDVKGILSRVQKEMNASFVWLFQQVFSHTPTLMVSVMILLANFTVYSMANNTAIAASHPHPMETVTEFVSLTENENQQQHKFDSSSIKTFSVSSSIGGNNGGGGKFKLVAGGDGLYDESSSSSFPGSIVPDEVSQVSSMGNPTSSTQEMVNEEELKLWNSIVEEASSMQRAVRDEALDDETMKQFVSPVTAESEPEDYSDYVKTELLYQLALSQEPQNPLLLSNYAQFLYLVVHDHDRAEEYFNRAIKVESGAPDAEALSRYANFLWQVRKDLGAAEQTYLEAIAADPANTFYASNYAHFLWNTGGDDTCYPLNSSSSNSISATNEAA